MPATFPFDPSDYSDYSIPRSSCIAQEETGVVVTRSMSQADYIHKNKVVLTALIYDAAQLMAKELFKFYFRRELLPLRTVAKLFFSLKDDFMANVATLAWMLKIQRMYHALSYPADLDLVKNFGAFSEFKVLYDGYTPLALSQVLKYPGGVDADAMTVSDMTFCSLGVTAECAYVSVLANVLQHMMAVAIATNTAVAIEFAAGVFKVYCRHHPEKDRHYVGMFKSHSSIKYAPVSKPVMSPPFDLVGSCLRFDPLDEFSRVVLPLLQSRKDILKAMSDDI